jgi:hypothetical protein
VKKTFEKYPNLIKNRSKKERQAIARKGGKASGQARKSIKTIQEYVLQLLQKENNEVSVKDALARKIIALALGGDMKAIELTLKVIGEMPSEKQETTLKGDISINDLSKLPMAALAKMAREAKIEIKDNER